MKIYKKNGKMVLVLVTILWVYNIHVRDVTRTIIMKFISFNLLGNEVEHHNLVMKHVVRS